MAVNTEKIGRTTERMQEYIEWKDQRESAHKRKRGKNNGRSDEKNDKRLNPAQASAYSKG